LNKANEADIAGVGDARGRTLIERDTWIDSEGNFRRVAAPLGPLVDFVAGIRSSVHAKLVGGFFIGTILLLGLFILSAIVVDRMSRQVNDLNRAQAQVDLARQMEYLITTQSHFRAMALLTDKASYNDSIADAKKEFTKQLNTMEKLSPESAAEINALREIDQRFAGLSSEVLALYEEGKIDEATEAHLRSEHPVSHELESILGQLIVDNTDKLTESVSMFRSRQKIFEIIIVAFSLVSLVVVLMVGFVLSWSFIRPLWKIDNVLARVAKGDFSQQLQIPNRDEFGTLGDNINSMSSELRRLYDEQEHELAERRRLMEALAHRTQELAAANQELESFSYSVSHDLRAPLRSMDGFSHALMEDYSDTLDDNGLDYLHRISAASQRMGELIDDLLTLSRVTRAEISREQIDLSELANSVAQNLREANPGKDVTYKSVDSATVTGDPHLLKVLLENLMGNAWKYSSKQSNPIVEFGMKESDDGTTYFVRDNGAGFDMTFVDKLFNPFQRLHAASEFEGTGIGLATVRRIVNRHGGRVWAEGIVGEGAVFYFTLNQGRQGQ
jgi:signal transduction histidine kinase